MNRLTRTALAVVAGGALVGGTLTAGAGAAQAAPSMQPFPMVYSNVKMPPMRDQQGKPDPLNKVVWPHMTVLTHSQSVLVRDNGGVTGVIGNSRTAPYAAIANSARASLSHAVTRRIIARGGCLVMYWQDRDIHVPGYGWIGAYTYPTNPENCHR